MLFAMVELVNNTVENEPFKVIENIRNENVKCNF